VLKLAIVLLSGSRLLVPTVMEGGGHFRQRAAVLLTEDCGRDPRVITYVKALRLPPPETVSAERMFWGSRASRRPTPSCPGCTRGLALNSPTPFSPCWVPVPPPALLLLRSKAAVWEAQGRVVHYVRYVQDRVGRMW